jgi:hypothetical protein
MILIFNVKHLIKEKNMIPFLRNQNIGKEKIDLKILK